MQFLSDENVYYKTVKFLRGLGYGVRTVEDLNIKRASDVVLLREAVKRKKIVISRDKDFINLALFSNISHYGVVVLRMSPETEDEVHAVLKESLEKRSSLKDQLIIVDAEGYKVEKRVK